LIEKQKLTWVYLVSAAFILLNTVLVIKEFYYLSFLIPIGLTIILLYLFALDKLILLIVFLTPIAVNVRNLELSVGISLPTEPLLFGVLVLFLFKTLREGKYDPRVLKHPVSIAIILNLIWIFFTSLTSELPLVSGKFFIARLWFVIPMYFIGIQLFRKYKNIKLFSWLYIIPLLGVIAYTIFNHAHLGFDEEAGHWVMTPFFNDHTAYGVILAFFIPVFIGFTFNKVHSKTIRLASFAVTVILIIALILSFSRAAWISLAVSFLFYLILLFRIKIRWILIVLAVFVGIFFSFKWEILDTLEKNKQDSSADFVEHVQSIANISSDASNLERINRWQSAIRMFHEKPILGWGPGTYQFFYAPFQRSKEKTIISTNFGDLGNAHSEYIGPLAESGLFGMITMLAIVFAAIWTGMRVFKRSENNEIKLLALVTMLALVSYFAHGLLNNFLDSDKASIPVWGFIAILVALDLYFSKKEDSISD